MIEETMTKENVLLEVQRTRVINELRATEERYRLVVTQLKIFDHNFVSIIIVVVGALLQ